MALPAIQSKKGLKQILAATPLSVLATTAMAGQDITTNNTHEVGYFIKVLIGYVVPNIAHFPLKRS